MPAAWWMNVAVGGLTGIALVARAGVGEGDPEAPQTTSVPAKFAAAPESGAIRPNGVDARWFTGLLPAALSGSAPAAGLTDGAVPIESKLVRDQVTKVPADLRDDVLAFFDAREAARTLVATLPEDAYAVHHGGLDEIRQCMAFDIAGAVLARRLVDAGTRGTLPAGTSRDRIARLHLAIVDQMNFELEPALPPEHRRGLAGAVGIEDEPREVPVSYTFTRALGDDRVPALAALLSTFGWVVADSPRTPWRDELLRTLPAMADLVDRPTRPATFWEWSRLLCQQVAFENLGPLYYMDVDVSGGGKPSLEQRLTSGQPVHVTLNNAGSRPIVGRLMAVLVSEPLKPNAWNPRIEALRDIDFQVGASARIDIALDLPRAVDAGRRYVLLLDPANAFAPTYAWFSGPRLPLETCASRALQDVRKTPVGSLESVLLAYANDATSNFANLTKEDRQFGLAMGRRQTLAVPGALSTSFIPAPWGDTISSTMYKGDSMQDARRTFARLEARLRTLCGRDVGKVVRAEDETEVGVKASLTMKTFATDASLDLTLSRWPGTSGKAQVKVDLNVGAPGVVD